MDFLICAKTYLNSIRYFENRLKVLEADDLMREVLGDKEVHTKEISFLKECIEILWQCCYELPQFANLNETHNLN